MYESRKQKLLSRGKFLRRLLRNMLLGLGLICLALAIGMAGYRHFEGLGWVDAYLNAAMILSGMGEVAELKTTAGKIFAGTYALFSGIMFLVVIALIFAPLVHRFFHKFHMADDSGTKASN